MEGTAPELPINLIIANMYMEHFKQRALGTAENALGYGEGVCMIPHNKANKTQGNVK